MSEAANIKIEGKSIPRRISENLQALRTGFKDEIPEEILHSNSKKPNNIKARKGGLLTPVVAYLSLGLSQGEIADPKIAEEIEGFIQRYTSKSFHAQPSTTKEDIERANRTIDLYLNNCKTK